MRIFCLFGLCFLTACGFHPLYAQHGTGPVAAAPALSNVRVSIIADAEGQELRNAILDRMPPPVAMPRYTLNITLTEMTTGIAIAQDATITRQQLRITLHADLIDSQIKLPPPNAAPVLPAAPVAADGTPLPPKPPTNVVWQQDLFSTAGYNVLSSEFSTLVGQEDARKRDVDDLAERLVEMVAMYFERPAS